MPPSRTEPVTGCVHDVAVNAALLTGAIRRGRPARVVRHHMRTLHDAMLCLDAELLIQPAADLADLWLAVRDETVGRHIATLADTGLDANPRHRATAPTSTSQADDSRHLRIPAR